MISKESPSTCEVLIVGGGLVGGTLAVALAEAGIATVLVDHDKPETIIAPAYDGRSSAIALASQRVLAMLGLWPGMEPYGEAIREIRVSDGNSLMFLHYDHKEIGPEPLGWIVENRGFRASLYRKFAELPALTLLAPSKITGWTHNHSGIIAGLQDGREIRARLLVGADGRKSQVREGAKIGLTHWDYKQVGLVATLRHEIPHRGIAQERFLPAGPFAVLPLPGDRSSLVWTEPPEIAAYLARCPEEEFISEMQLRLDGLLGAIRIEGPRFAYPLSLQFADSYIGPRLALVGDAAHGMHPIAGQGMNMGLRDVAALAEIIIQAERHGADPGAAGALAKYQRWRRGDNLLMLGVTDGLNRLFSNDIPPIRLARDLGLAAVHRLPGLKKLFMRHAMGLAGDLPRLMRGLPV